MKKWKSWLILLKSLKKLINSGDNDGGRQVLKDIDEDYKKYSIRSDIDSLKEEVEEKADKEINKPEEMRIYEEELIGII